jgi:pimeloyl-ACP methyl ester carboxylesterase
MFKRIKLLIVLGTSSLGIGLLASPPLYAAEPMPTVRAEEMAVQYHTVKIDGVNVFYREAGPKDAPAVLLLHGFPASSFMFRNLIPILATRYHVIAPDYPGYGQSDAPDHTTFHYTFDHLASIVDQLTQMLNLEKFSIYVQDYGAPVGYRIAVAHPEKRARLEGVLTPDGYKSQYLTGVKDPSAISPDTWSLDAANLARPGNMDIQLDLLLDYGSNPPLYPKWQEYFRTSQPPMLIVWGKNDLIFPPTGAEPYKRDIKDLDFHLLDTGHFALEDSSVEIGDLMLKFLDKHVGKQQTTGMAPSNGGQPLARLEH